MKLVLASIAGLLCSLPVAAQTAGVRPESFEWKLNGARSADDPSRATKGGFGAMMIVTPDIDAFWKAWEGPTPPNIVTATSVSSGRPVHAVVLYSGCLPDQSGECRIDLRFRMIGPDGIQYGDTQDVDPMATKPAPDYNLQALPFTLGFLLEPSDPVGRYTFVADVTDMIRGTTLTIKSDVTTKR